MTLMRSPGSMRRIIDGCGATGRKLRGGLGAGRGAQDRPIGAACQPRRTGRWRACLAPPQAKVSIFGHLADGNLHIEIAGVEPGDEALDRAVLDLTTSLGGAVSAEHGVGRAKSAWLGLSRSPADVAVMRRIKDALDPVGILTRRRPAAVTCSMTSRGRLVMMPSTPSSRHSSTSAGSSTVHTCTLPPDSCTRRT